MRNECRPASPGPAASAGPGPRWISPALQVRGQRRVRLLPADDSAISPSVTIWHSRSEAADDEHQRGHGQP
jgi:hypothetical protein